MNNYWLWVAMDGGMPSTVNNDMKDWIWEGCDSKTKKEDKVLIYLTSPHKYIKYLAKVTEDAKEGMINTKNGLKEGYKCYFDILYEFGVPLKIAQMRKEPTLEGWYPLKMSFIRKVFPIEEKYWVDLKMILTDRNQKSVDLF